MNQRAVTTQRSVLGHLLTKCRGLHVAAVSAALLGAACGPLPELIQAQPLRAPDARLAPPRGIAQAISLSAQAPQQAVAVCLAKQSEITFLRSAGVGPHDLSGPLLGHETSVEVDIDADGGGDTVYAFTSLPDPEVYLTWREGETCHLAWGGKGFYWQVQAPCGVDGPALVCLHDETDASVDCDRCDGDACHRCEAIGLDVYCD